MGEILTADTTGIADGDGLDNAAFAYQWLADDAEINGANASTYTLADADAGKAIKVKVSFTDDAGNDEELTSAATGAVAAAVVTRPLTATVHGVPSSHNGQNAFTFELRFSEAPKAGLQLHDGAGPCVHCDRGIGDLCAQAGPARQHPLGDHRHPQLQRRRGHSPERHHRLLCPGSYLHGRR